MVTRRSLYFDRQDRDILVLVNRMLESSPPDDGRFDPKLHPHGIKEMIASPVSRIAHAVINLLRMESKELHAKDRLLALQTLYDEVLSSTHSVLRRNTARVLMQIMKRIVHAHGQNLKQLKLAHDFRIAIHGTPRIVRRLLAQHHLPEMPEEWNQLAFDDHVYDANSKGRKSPTHLLMDAWIKGIRSLTVAYEYCIDPRVAGEMLSAAKITGITVRIGLEFQLPFYDQSIRLLWIPRGFTSDDDFIEFLHNPHVAAMQERGKKVLRWKKERVLQRLAAWNAFQRPQLAAAWETELPELTDDTFLSFVGRGQPSNIHLAECLHKHLMPAAKKRAEKLVANHDEASLAELAALENLRPEIILDDWLSSALHPEMPSSEPQTHDNTLPELLRLTPYQLTQELVALTQGYRLALSSAGLSVDDVTELLWDCQGAITHLEIFNMKAWMENKLSNIAAISELQRSLNHGLGPRVKQMVRQMIRRMESSGNVERTEKFQKILRNMPKLWKHYSQNPLKSRLGTSSAGRLSFGMGLIYAETLPKRALKALCKKQEHAKPIPIFAPIRESVTFLHPVNPTFWQRLKAKLRQLPGCRHLGMDSQREWIAASETCVYSPRGNIVNLGGLNTSVKNNLSGNTRPAEDTSPPITYLNSSITNCLKVLIGFIPAFFSFQYTQQVWFLAWFGSVIWFGITGVRNVLQMVMAAKGATRGTLIHWKAQINVSRLCDSLMYTGISVLLLEVIVRVVLLKDYLGISVDKNPVTVFATLSIINGLYIFSHNTFRGFPKTAAVGNLFRSVLAIPVSSLYYFMLLNGMIALGVSNPEIYLIPSAAVASKSASDTVAAIIEGYADSQVNLRMRCWDFRSKIANIFDQYTKLELLFPQDNALIKLTRTKGLENGGAEGRALEKAFIINALDLMYFWFYQPRAQDAFRQIIRTMPKADRIVLVRSQLVLMREHEISQMLVDGLLGRDFAFPLAFFLSKHKTYLRRFIRCCQLGGARKRSARALRLLRAHYS
ncbi:MAG: hypothetical protein LBV65_04325 [Desulfovibrio sp.]|nr:hypothetical protein [Desulfovibrio sp.]